jgi:hypothetical protein
MKHLLSKSTTVNSQENTMNSFNMNAKTSAMSKGFRLTAITFTLLLGFSHTAFAGTNQYSQDQSAAQWRPVASDKLIKLPANIIEKRIQQDFQASPMAMRMANLESEMQDKISDIKSLAQLTPEQGSEAYLDKQYQTLAYKSDYLDLLQESHDLRQKALAQKQSLYKNVLDKVRHQSGKVNGSAVYQLKQSQEAARTRMEKVMARVDQAMVHSGMEKPSAYADEYSKNLSQIESLKLAIGRHKSNASLQQDGVDISSQEYLRQLLMSVSGEQSLLDQEALMLSYMAKLVALDAQALEFEVAYGNEEQAELAKETIKPASVTSLFYQE